MPRLTTSKTQLPFDHYALRGKRPLRGTHFGAASARPWPVNDGRRINKRANTSRSPNSVRSDGVSTKRSYLHGHASVNAAGTISLRSQIATLKTAAASVASTCSRSSETWRNHGGDDSQQHSRRRCARHASFEPHSLGHNVALRVSGRLSCKDSEMLRRFADARPLSRGAGSR